MNGNTAVNLHTQSAALGYQLFCSLPAYPPAAFLLVELSQHPAARLREFINHNYPQSMLGRRCCSG
ncbi:hypothetical protein D3C72_1263720 [compost metagenome]